MLHFRLLDGTPVVTKSNVKITNGSFFIARTSTVRLLRRRHWRDMRRCRRRCGNHGFDPSLFDLQLQSINLMLFNGMPLHGLCSLLSLFAQRGFPNVSRCFFVQPATEVSQSTFLLFLRRFGNGKPSLSTSSKSSLGNPQSLQHREHHVLIQLLCFFRIIRLGTKLSWLHNTWSTPEHWPSH